MNFYINTHKHTLKNIHTASCNLNPFIRNTPLEHITIETPAKLSLPKRLAFKALMIPGLTKVPAELPTNNSCHTRLVFWDFPNKYLHHLNHSAVSEGSNEQETK